MAAWWQLDRVMLVSEQRGRGPRLSSTHRPQTGRQAHGHVLSLQGACTILTVPGARPQGAFLPPPLPETVVPWGHSQGDSPTRTLKLGSSRQGSGRGDCAGPAPVEGGASPSGAGDGAQAERLRCPSGIRGRGGLGSVHTRPGTGPPLACMRIPDARAHTPNTPCAHSSAHAVHTPHSQPGPSLTLTLA